MYVSIVSAIDPWAPIKLHRGLQYVDKPFFEIEMVLVSMLELLVISHFHISYLSICVFTDIAD